MTPEEIALIIQLTPEVIDVIKTLISAEPEIIKAINTLIKR